METKASFNSSFRRNNHGKKDRISEMLPEISAADQTIYDHGTGMIIFPS